MKKWIALAVCILMLSGGVAYARRYTKVVPLKQATNGATIEGYDLKSGITYYTEPVVVGDAVVGTGALVVDLLGAHDLDINWEVADSYTLEQGGGTNWYIPTTVDNVLDGDIITALTTDRWINFDQYNSKYLRFKIDPDATGKATLLYIYQTSD